MVSKSIPGALVLICTTSLMGLARADNHSPLEICRDLSNPAAFDGCTAAIESNEVYGGALATVYGNRALLYLAQHDLAHALADINVAIKIDISSASYRRTRALISWLTGKDEEAAKDAGEAIWLDTSFALPYVIRGRVKAKQNQFLPAIEDFTHALQLTPNDAEVLYQPAQFLTRRGFPSRGKS